MGLFDKIKKAIMGEEPEATPEAEPASTDENQQPETTAVSEEPATADFETEEQTEEMEATIPTQEPTSDGSTEPAEATPVIEEKWPDSEATETDKAAVVEKEADQLKEIAEPPVTTPVEKPQNTQEKYEQGLTKTRKTFGQKLNELFANFRSVDEDFFEEVEETLIGADVGFDAAIKISDQLRQEVKLKNVKKPADVQNVIIEKMVDLYDEAGIDEVNALNIQANGPTVMLFVGVNGVGKTTSIGKLAYQYKQAGKKVLLAAADTFRAGAIDQLVVWGERAGVEVVRGNAGGDPAAVVYDAVAKAQKEDVDILLVDTAGRLQNKVNLMNELEKIKRVIQRELPEAPHEVLLVLDATTGQNAMVQAKQFKETTDVTGLVLTKLDGTAKGGIVLAIRNELHLPVKLVGLGEGIDDLEPFDPNEFIVGLLKGLIK